MAQALGHPPWYQLYPSSHSEVTEKLVRRAEAAGCPVLVVTVDNTAGRNTETQQRLRRLDNRQCSACHGTEPGAHYKRYPMFEGLDLTKANTTYPGLTWDFVDRWKKQTSMKIVLKGIVTHEDARLCVEHGVDGIIVSNHGGRETESGMSTIESLTEIVDAVGGHIPVLIDSGFRRGTDVFKALALGARAVGIGRPYLWGLGAFGQAGVERVLDIMRGELELIMRQCGTRSLDEISRSYITRA